MHFGLGIQGSGPPVVRGYPVYPLPSPNVRGIHPLMRVGIGPSSGGPLDHFGPLSDTSGFMHLGVKQQGSNTMFGPLIWCIGGPLLRI